MEAHIGGEKSGRWGFAVLGDKVLGLFLPFVTKEMTL
jgi:hypothetical protein